MNPQSPATTMSKPAGVKPKQILHAKLKHKEDMVNAYWEIQNYFQSFTQNTPSEVDEILTDLFLMIVDEKILMWKKSSQTTIAKLWISQKSNRVFP